MQALHALLVSAVIMETASAQVVFDLPGAIPPNGVLPRQFWFADPITIPLTGTNVTWDFSNGLTNTGIVNDLVITQPASSPFSNTFPNATHAAGVVTASANSATWRYFQLSGDSLHYLGLASTQSENTCPDPWTKVVFPFSYGELVEDSAYCGPPGSPTPMHRGWELVATGTMITPLGTVPAVALVRIHSNGSPTPYYEFYEYGNILAYIGAYDDVTLSIWPSQSALGMTGGDGPTALRAYPQPASEEILVEVGQLVGPAWFVLLDAVGREMEAGTLNAVNGRARIDVSHLAPGNYLARIECGSVTAYARISVAH